MAASGRHHEGHGRDELIQDEVDDLPGDDRDAGWDADDEYERVR